MTIFKLWLLFTLIPKIHMISVLVYLLLIK